MVVCFFLEVFLMNKKTVVTLSALLLCAGSHMNAEGGYFSKGYDVSKRYLSTVAVVGGLGYFVDRAGKLMPSKSAVVNTASSLASGAKNGACYVGKKVVNHPYITGVVTGVVVSVGTGLALYKWYMLKKAPKAAEEANSAEVVVAETQVVDGVNNDSVAADKMAADKMAADKMAADKKAADKKAADKKVADKKAADKKAADKKAADKKAADKKAAEATVASTNNA
jgi:hypothetical protein